MVFPVLLRDLCTQEIYFAFLFMRGKLSGEAEWSMTRDGNHAFEITAMPAYCDAEKKLVAAEDNLLRIKDIIETLQEQVGPLENQSKKARKYLDLREVLKGLDINIAIRNIDKQKINLEEGKKKFKEALWFLMVLPVFRFKRNSQRTLTILLLKTPNLKTL